MTGTTVKEIVRNQLLVPFEVSKPLSSNNVAIGQSCYRLLLSNCFCMSDIWHLKVPHSSTF